MPNMCEVPGCKEIGAHRFPAAEEVRKQWIKAIRRTNFEPKKQSRICRFHFLDTDYQKISNYTGIEHQHRYLKKAAVPSVFRWTTKISSTPKAQTRKADTIEKGHSTKKYGHCRCCLKVDNHSVGNVWEMLECLKVEVSRDPRVTLLLCSECDKFLQEARRFRDMVAASQRTLLGDIPNALDRNIEDTVVTVKVEFEPDMLNVKEETMELESNVRVPSPNMIESDQPSTNMAVLKKYLRSDVTIGLHTALKQEPFEEPVPTRETSIAVPTELNKDAQIPDDGRMEDDRGFSELSDNDTDVEMDATEDRPKLTAKEVKNMEKIMESQLNLQIRENLSTILQNSTVISFITVKGDRFECIYCDNNYLHFIDLRNHVETHDEEFEFKLQALKLLALKVEAETILSADISCVKCRLCDEQLKTIDNLVEHLINVHEKKYHNITRDPPHNILCFDMSLDSLKCLDCDKTFTHFKGLMKHMNEHYGSYLCPECGCKFLHERSYKLHLMYESRRDQPRPRCSLCDSTFARKDHLRRHERTKHPNAPA